MPTRVVRRTRHEKRGIAIRRGGYKNEQHLRPHLTRRDTLHSRTEEKPRSRINRGLLHAARSPRLAFAPIRTRSFDVKHYKMFAAITFHPRDSALSRTRLILFSCVSLLCWFHRLRSSPGRYRGWDGQRAVETMHTIVTSHRSEQHQDRDFLQQALRVRDVNIGPVAIRATLPAYPEHFHLQAI
jgi:hypothetical protein